ncbi:hypothetical protein BLNAU_5207 [Blattamonas nauphoetae]|uniref:Uncharacterized protein n=1 Tax=Blattamonas nauphoetae TaxID=2049346 RepID=A0ABQ9Y7L4_9EUKA|nr:hypothetical protein BLNAU_5207 [Blattamonas nauphoetae]
MMLTYVVTKMMEYTFTFTSSKPTGDYNDVVITFRNGDCISSAVGKMDAINGSFSDYFSVSDTPQCGGGLEIGTTYTIASEEFRCHSSTFTPVDNRILTGFSKLTPAEDGKKDGTKDKIVLTLTNALLPAELPEDSANYLMLYEAHASRGMIDHELSKGEKFKWTPAAGSLAVEYVFNDCPIKAGSTVRVELNITEEISYAEQFIEYAEGAKSVALVVAALFAVLALVF